MKITAIKTAWQRARSMHSTPSWMMARSSTGSAAPPPARAKRYP